MTQSTNALTARPQGAPHHTAVEQSSPLLALPPELLLNILEKLGLKDNRACSLVCKQLKAVADDDSLWRLLFARDFQPSADLPNTGDSLEAYKGRHILPSNLRNGVFASRFLAAHRDQVCSLVLANGLLCSRSLDETIRIWNVRTDECMRTLEGYAGRVHDFFVANGLLFSGSFGGTIKIWDLRSGECKRIFEGHAGEVTSLTVADHLLFSGFADGTIKIWNYQTGVCLRTLDAHTIEVNSLSFSDGMLFSRSADSTIKVWELRSGECLLIFAGHESPVSALFVAEGKLVLAFEMGIFEIWDIKTEQILATHGLQSPVSYFALVDGKLFSVSRNGTIKIWHFQTGEYLSLLEGPSTSHFYTSHFLADGMLVSGFSNGMIQIRDFMAADNAVFAEIASQLRSMNPEIVKIALERFSRMPKRARDKVYQELSEHAFHDKEGQSSTHQQRAWAIENYLAKQGIATAADPAEHQPQGNTK